MKSSWEFSYSTKDLLFQNKKTYIIDSNKDSQETKSAMLIIIPETDAKSSEYTGKIHITVPEPYKTAKPHVLNILIQFTERIKFYNNEKINIETGLILGEHIPENEKERKDLGDKTYFAEMNFETIPTPDTEIEPEMHNSHDLRLITQYNYAKESNHPISQFNGYFKILENRYLKGIPREKMKENLNNIELENIYSDTFPDDTNYEDFIDMIVNCRHKCSHLKNNYNFGWLPYDSQINEIVVPLIGKLEKLTYKLIYMLVI